MIAYHTSGAGALRGDWEGVGVGRLHPNYVPGFTSPMQYTATFVSSHSTAFFLACGRIFNFMPIKACIGLI